MLNTRRCHNSSPTRVQVSRSIIHTSLRSSPIGAQLQGLSTLGNSARYSPQRLSAMVESVVLQTRTKAVKEVQSAQEVDTILTELHNACEDGHAMPRKEKIMLLEEVTGRVSEVSLDIGAAFTKLMGFPKGSDPDNRNGLWQTMTLENTCNTFIKQLEDLDSEGQVPTVKFARKTADGRSVIDMGMCSSEKDDLLSLGAHAWLYTQTSKKLTQGNEASELHSAAGTGVAVVLGAGNQPALCIEDSLHMLLDKNLPVLLKHHPVEAEVAPIWEYVMEPLEKAGVYRGILADLPLTQSAIYSDRTAAVHLTGALKTYDDILWGPGEEGKKRKAGNTPLLKVPFTAELGNVTPAFIVPGVWTQEDMVVAAKWIVAAASNNAGCNCIATKVILMSSEWPQADEFEAVVKDMFSVFPANPTWYPGSKKRYNTFLEAHPDCEFVESSRTIPEGTDYSEEVLPWALMSITLDSEEEAGSITGLQEEFFAPVSIFLRVPTAKTANGESSTEHSAAEGFMQYMPSFVQKNMYGDLGCGVFLPDSVKTALPETSQNFIDELRYGAVVVNSMSFAAYGCRSGCWGGHMSPESNSQNVGSGLGKIHNFSRVDELEKCVMEFPWGHDLPM